MGINEKIKREERREEKTQDTLIEWKIEYSRRRCIFHKYNKDYKM